MSQLPPSQRIAISPVTWKPNALSNTATVPVSCHGGCHDWNGDLGKQQRRLGPATSAQVISSCSSWPGFLFQQACKHGFIFAPGYMGCSLLCYILYHSQVLTLSVCCSQFESSRSVASRAELQHSKCSDSIRLSIAELCGPVLAGQSSSTVATEPGDQCMTTRCKLAQRASCYTVTSS